MVYVNNDWCYYTYGNNCGYVFCVINRTHIVSA